MVATTSLTGCLEEEKKGDNHIAEVETSMGTMIIELFEDKMPTTTENFIQLVNEGFYDGMIFYRISDGFMIQAGRYYPDGSQKSSPYGTIEFETHPDVKHVDGAISMARATELDSASAEFFICDGAQQGLDDDYLQQYGLRGYAAFGVVTEGIEVVRTIADQPHDNAHPAGGGKPLTDIIIHSITIL
jgi:cyclophilin family peptidyl-prolyl cis-trans isomerase